jgi:hypothetical protein
MNSFDVSPDGKQIRFDGYRENSDIMSIVLPPRRTKAPISTPTGFGRTDGSRIAIRAAGLSRVA